MWVWPLLMLAIQTARSNQDQWRKTRIALLTLAFIPFAVNSPDLVGTRARLVLDEGGLGIANLLILAAALIGNKHNTPG
jgi:hypothetical protein